MGTDQQWRGESPDAHYTSGILDRHQVKETAFWGGQGKVSASLILSFALEILYEVLWTFFCLFFITITGKTKQYGWVLGSKYNREYICYSFRRNVGVNCVVIFSCQGSACSHRNSNVDRKRRAC